MNGSGKHSSLLRYGNNYCRKMFYSTSSCFAMTLYDNIYNDDIVVMIIMMNSYNDFLKAMRLTIIKRYKQIQELFQLRIR
jgi:hypothetical protein